MRGGRKQGSRGEMNGDDGDADGRGGKGEGKGDEMWRCKVGLGLGWWLASGVSTTMVGIAISMAATSPTASQTKKPRLPWVGV